MTDLRYPIGKFQAPAEYNTIVRKLNIQQLEEMPAQLRAAVKGLSNEQLSEPYRKGGWTLRQVVHHLADSHLNAYVRFKLAMTEDIPTIKPYNEKAWAGLEDSVKADVEVSLVLVKSLHQRLVMMLKSLDDKQFARSYMHPETGKGSVDRMLALYAWHGRHHIAHITTLRESNAW